MRQPISNEEILGGYLIYIHSSRLGDDGLCGAARRARHTRHYVGVLDGDRILPNSSHHLDRHLRSENRGRGAEREVTQHHVELVVQLGVLRTGEHSCQKRRTLWEYSITSE